MTREDIIRMAREAGGLDLLCATHGFTDTLEQFAALVAAAEREACARFVEKEYERQFENPWREDLAEAIRART